MALELIHELEDIGNENIENSNEIRSSMYVVLKGSSYCDKPERNESDRNDISTNALKHLCLEKDQISE